jgi:hypothetical protein
MVEIELIRLFDGIIEFGGFTIPGECGHRPDYVLSSALPVVQSVGEQ